MKRYIVIEDFDPAYPWIVTNTDGIPLIFETKEEAEEEASQCQNGKVVEL
jgi:hypothetical protein